MLRVAAFAVVSAAALAACSAPVASPNALDATSATAWSCGNDPVVARPASVGESTNAARTVPGTVTVVARPRDGATIRALGGPRARLATRTVGGLVRYELPRLEAAATIEALRASGAVEYAEIDPIVRASAAAVVPTDPWWPRQWAPVRTGSDEAWARTRGTASTVVAVLDTGVACGQPDLAGALVQGTDMVDDDADPNDPAGHGTLVAGVLAARIGNDIGGTGICPGCSVMPVRVLAADGSGRASDVAEGIIWAVDRGARVLNLSLGTPARSRALEDAVAYARARGAIIVAAAGNAGTSVPQYPAAFDGVIAVGATDDQDRRYSWSNRGAWVDVSAPGFNIAGRADGTLAGFAGTSSAAPVVSAIAALALSADPTATAADVERAILASLAPALDGAPGRIDAAATLDALATR